MRRKGGFEDVEAPLGRREEASNEAEFLSGIEDDGPNML